MGDSSSKKKLFTLEIVNLGVSIILGYPCFMRHISHNFPYPGLIKINWGQAQCEKGCRVAHTNYPYEKEVYFKFILCSILK